MRCIYGILTGLICSSLKVSHYVIRNRSHWFRIHMKINTTFYSLPHHRHEVNRAKLSAFLVFSFCMQFPKWCFKHTALLSFIHFNVTNMLLPFTIYFHDSLSLSRKEFPMPNTHICKKMLVKTLSQHLADTEIKLYLLFGNFSIVHSQLLEISQWERGLRQELRTCVKLYYEFAHQRDSTEVYGSTANPRGHWLKMWAKIIKHPDVQHNRNMTDTSHCRIELAVKQKGKKGR